jgi:Uma2 family endonuclease
MIGDVEAAKRATEPDPRLVEHRVVLHNVPWEVYEALDRGRRDKAVPRLTYLDGELEVAVPSTFHETWKTLLARLVEAHGEERGVRLNGVGSWTIKKELEKAGLEPDECYVIGKSPHDCERPDFAIEDVWTSGSLSKLEVYRRLRVPEVWFFDGDALRFYALRKERYIECARSRYLPDLDPVVLARFVLEDDQTGAVMAYRTLLRGG